MQRQPHTKPLQALGSIDDDLVLCVLVNVSGVDHLVHELGGGLVGGGLMLGFFDSSSQVGQLLQFLLEFLLLEVILLLFVLDLGFCPSPLAADLQHAGSDSLVHYSWTGDQG